MNDIRPADIRFIQPWPIKHMHPHGQLPLIPEAAALWQFLIMATQAVERVPSQTTLEGEQDQQVDMMQLATSAATIYGITDLNTMFQDRLVYAARSEALACKLPWKPEITTFIESGGRSARDLDRDANKVGL